MHRIFSILLILIGTRTVVAQTIPCADSTNLRTRLNTIMEIDQNSRKEFIKQLSENNPQKSKELALQMKKTDKENQQFVSELLDNCGWPKGLPAENNHTIFLVIDHAETAYANKYFPYIKQQAELGIILKSDLATLQDRIMLKKGKKQLYGTQTFKVGPIIHVWPVDNINGLSERRKAMGLPPMDEYIQTVKNRYRSKVEWNRSLTVEDAQQLMRKKL